MIKEIIITLLPSLLVLGFILLSTMLLKKAKLARGLKSIGFGIVAVIPALITIHLLTAILNISLPSSLPAILIICLSALNEEAYKYVFIKKSYDKEFNIVYGLLIAGGFALGETLYFAFGDLETSYYRSILTLPLHMLTSIFLSLYYKKRRLLFLTIALIIHILFNILLA